MRERKTFKFIGLKEKSRHPSFEEKTFVEANDHFGLLSIELGEKLIFLPRESDGKSGSCLETEGKRRRDGKKKMKEVSDDKCELIA